MTEQGLMIGAELAGQTVTLEPGGQFELSGAPVSNLHLTDSEVNSHLFQARFWNTATGQVGLVQRGVLQHRGQ